MRILPSTSAAPFRSMNRARDSRAIRRARRCRNHAGGHAGIDAGFSGAEVIVQSRQQRIVRLQTPSRKVHAPVWPALRASLLRRSRGTRPTLTASSAWPSSLTGVASRHGV
jgi:hypothetical protein